MRQGPRSFFNPEKLLLNSREAIGKALDVKKVRRKRLIRTPAQVISMREGGRRARFMHREMRCVDRNGSGSIPLIKGLKQGRVSHMSSQTGNRGTAAKTPREGRLAVTARTREMQEKPALVIKSRAC